jgi:hypothetical protein
LSDTDLNDRAAEVLAGMTEEDRVSLQVLAWLHCAGRGLLLDGLEPRLRERGLTRACSTPPGYVITPLGHAVLRAWTRLRQVQVSLESS